MSRKLFICLTLSFLALAVGTPSAVAQSFKWWKQDRFINALALTADQSSRLESLFQAAQPALRAQKRALDKLEDELSNMIHDTTLEEAEIEQFVGRVEDARAELSKSRQMMLVRMRRVLTADQSAKLHKLLEQDEKQRRSKPHGPSRNK